METGWHYTPGGMHLDSRSALVFPAGMPPSLVWARHACGNGIRIVGASSLPHDPARANYAEWASLPWIGDVDFSSALSRCLTEKRIDTVFTPHPVVWSKLRELLPKVAPGTRLEPEQPWAAELGDYRAYREIAARFDRDPLQAGSGDPAPAMPVVKLAALVRSFQLVPGECDDAKLEALAAIFRRMPCGDLVEIGSLWGRSAVAVAFLAKHYNIGNLLCVDPWQSAEIHQGIEAVDAVFDAAPLEDVFEAFRINLSAFAGSVNYARARSADAASVYTTQRSYLTEDFGRTIYSGRIALLHIDGNHALEAVRSDIAVWRRFVRPNGWIVLDDYCWPFGDGPRVAADELLAEWSARVASAFVAGGALFVQLSADSDPLCHAG
jgi:methyltransferase family protein